MSQERETGRDYRRQARRVEKPWGYELIWAEGERYVGKILHIDAGHALSYQYHRVKEETIYVLSGTLVVHYGEADAETQTVELAEGEAFFIPSGLRHRFEAPVDVELLETSTPELTDVVRLDDRYGRADT